MSRPAGPRWHHLLTVAAFGAASVQSPATGWASTILFPTGRRFDAIP